jgi:predicted nucleic acid-binding protein
MKYLVNTDWIIDHFRGVELILWEKIINLGDVFTTTIFLVDVNLNLTKIRYHAIPYDMT